MEELLNRSMICYELGPTSIVYIDFLSKLKKKRVSKPTNLELLYERLF